MVAACVIIEWLVWLLLVTHVTWSLERGHMHTSRMQNQA